MYYFFLNFLINFPKLICNIKILIKISQKVTCADPDFAYKSSPNCINNLCFIPLPITVVSPPFNHHQTAVRSITIGAKLTAKFFSITQGILHQTTRGFLSKVCLDLFDFGLISHFFWGIFSCVVLQWLRVGLFLKNPQERFY